MRKTHAVIGILSAGGIAAIASAQTTGPVIDAVTMRTELLRYEMVYPEFHFHDPSGTVRFIHREITATNSPKPLRIQDGIIEISPEQQMKAPSIPAVGRAGQNPTM